MVDTGSAAAVTEDYREGHFFVRENGVRMATPLFIAFVAIASTDILFALDSIPAVYGVTNEPYIVFVANAFALLGLAACHALLDWRGGRGWRRGTRRTTS